MASPPLRPIYFHAPLFYIHHQ